MSLVQKIQGKIVRFFKNPLLYFRHYFFVVPVNFLYGFTGRLTLYWLIFTKKNEEIYLLMTTLIGDSLYGLSCLYALHEKYIKKRIIVIGSSKLARLLESYHGIDRVILLKPDSFKYIAIFKNINNSYS